MRENVFCYGTLMFPQIMQKVTGIGGIGKAAELCQLYDYVRYQVRDEVFPAIVARPGGQTPGVLYRNLPFQALKRLDRYEGPLYRRQRVTVVTGQHSECRAWTYVIAPRYRHCLTAKSWDKTAFERKYLQRYLHRV